jgi:VWFA-related protein
MPRILPLALAAVLLQSAPQQSFKTAIDLVEVEVTVLDRSGKPVENLTPADFEVWTSGKPRKVVEIYRRTYGQTAAASSAAPVTSDDRAQTAAPGSGRKFILAIDEHSLQVGAGLAAVNAAERFIDRLQPTDLVGVHAYPTGTVTHDLTSDHAAVRRVLRNIRGLRVEPEGRFHLTVSEVIDIASGDPQAQRAVLQRECGRGGCRSDEIRAEATTLAAFLEMTATQSIAGLRGLVRGLGEIPGRKILVLVSGGLVSTDRSSGRVDPRAEISQLGRDAAAANLDVFALHLDWSFQESLASKGGLRTSYFRDSNLAATGLEIVAGTAGGTVIRVRGTSPDVAFSRIMRETSAYYVLGVECGDEDRDGRPRPIRVRVKRSGIEIRHRSQVIVPAR